MITREYLAQYTYLESQIKSMERKLRYYEKHPLTAYHGVVKGSMGGFPYAQCHFVVSAPEIKSDEERKRKISQLIIDVKGNKQLYEDMKLDIECFVENISDLEMKTIMQMKFVDNLPLEKIGDQLGYDKSSISKKIDRFLKSCEDSTNSTL